MELFDFDRSNFFFNLPLYTKRAIPPEKDLDLYNFLKAKARADAYNPILKENTTYEITCLDDKPIRAASLGTVYTESCRGYWSYQLKCLRTDERYSAYVFFDVETRTLQKIGQYPSIADIHIGKIKEYSKVLGDEKLKEFTRAIGLAANGVGIGSFVYLRRVFEDLIEEAHIAAKSENEWDEDKYRNARVNDRILMLKAHLPSFLVEQRNIYGILSKGIHELSEQDCLTYFTVVKNGIELILDEKKAKHDAEQRKAEARKSIEQITKGLK